jgi:hypothetical protein
MAMKALLSVALCLIGIPPVQAGVTITVSREVGGFLTIIGAGILAIFVIRFAFAVRRHNRMVDQGQYEREKPKGYNLAGDIKSPALDALVESDRRGLRYRDPAERKRMEEAEAARRNFIDALDALKKPPSKG